MWKLYKGGNARTPLGGAKLTGARCLGTSETLHASTEYLLLKKRQHLHCFP